MNFCILIENDNGIRAKQKEGLLSSTSVNVNTFLSTVSGKQKWQAVDDRWGSVPWSTSEGRATDLGILFFTFSLVDLSDTARPFFIKVGLIQVLKKYFFYIVTKGAGHQAAGALVIRNEKQSIQVGELNPAPAVGHVGQRGRPHGAKEDQVVQMLQLSVGFSGGCYNNNVIISHCIKTDWHRLRTCLVVGGHYTHYWPEDVL